MPRLELRRTNRTNPESTYLRQFRHNVTSQSGEDGIIEKIFELIGERNRWCVEFGAWDGQYLSNTWSLINEKGWSGVLIEANPERAAALAARHRDRAGSVFVETGFVGWEGDQSLDAILRRMPIPADFDLLSIDIDGNDWHVWNALAGYGPRVLVVEFNPSAGNEVVFVQDPEPSLNQGASLAAFIELGKRKGYELAAVTDANAIFVIAERFPLLGITDNSIDAMHQPISDMQVLQGFDGTIFAVGHTALLWHGVPIGHEDLQVLPEALRKYRDPGRQD
jgi:hypothetical protein